MLIIALGLVGCSDEPQIKGAWAEKGGGGDITVHVRVSSKDAEYIKNDQIYFSIVLNDCGNVGKRFPMEPLIDGRRASDFDFRIPRPEVELTSVAPAWVIDGYKNPCIMLEGGGYAGARLKSKQVPLQRERSRSVISEISKV